MTHCQCCSGSVEINDSRVTLAATDRYRLAVSEFTWRPDQPGFRRAALV